MTTAEVKHNQGRVPAAPGAGDGLWGGGHDHMLPTVIIAVLDFHPSTGSRSTLDEPIHAP